MNDINVIKYITLEGNGLQRLVVGLVFVILFSFNVFSQMASRPIRPHQQRMPVALNDTVATAIAVPEAMPMDSVASMPMDADSVDMVEAVDTLAAIPVEQLKAIQDSIETLEEFGPVREFSPDPTRAVWMSALCPGLGQFYNRSYWKLPIVVGAFMGLGYATSWNNRMLTDYTKAYRDIMDNDPSTKSYMDFYPPTVKEEDLDTTWLKNKLKSRRDYFRRNRDLCIIGIVGVYLIAMVDAYVDASLSQFDISPDLSVKLSPTLIPDSRTTLPSVGVHWALNF